MKACLTFAMCSALIHLAFLGRAATRAEADEPESTPRYVRIGHYQCICQQGDYQANLNKLIHGLELASEARLDVVSFPESFLTGYFRNEEEARANSFSIDSPQMKEVLGRTARFEPMFMVGFNEIRGDELY